MLGSFLQRHRYICYSIVHRCRSTKTLPGQHRSHDPTKHHHRSRHGSAQISNVEENFRLKIRVKIDGLGELKFSV